MKCFIVFSCVVLAVSVGQTVGKSYPATPSPCGSSNGLEGYKGACDESVPVVVLPKGRPIMESILDWFRCCTGSCNPPTTPPTSPPPTGWTPPTSWPTSPPPTTGWTSPPPTSGTWAPPTAVTPPPTGTWIPPPAPPTGTTPPPTGSAPPPVAG